MTRPHMHLLSLLAASLLLLLLLLPSHTALALATEELDADMPLIHGSRGYPHLDCSACLTVANILGARMNTSLKESSGTILVSHRLEKTVGDRRIQYRQSELRAIEIMENGCNQASYRENILRLNGKTKVREYHLFYQDEMLDANRAAMLEDTKFPEDEVQLFEHTKLRVPVGKHYTRVEQETFRERAPEVLCSFLMEEREDAIAAIIRNAEYLTQVEEQLCGFHHDWRPSEAESGEFWEGLKSPALHVCSDTEALIKSSKRDQQRWVRANKKAGPPPTSTEASEPVAEDNTDAADAGDL